MRPKDTRKALCPGRVVTSRCDRSGRKPMSGSTRTSADFDVRRRILFRAWHRGIREMDILMGRFADAELGALSAGELDEFERLIEVPDPDLFRWLTGEGEVPANYDTAVFRRLKSFHTHAGPIHS